AVAGLLRRLGDHAEGALRCVAEAPARFGREETAALPTIKERCAEMIFERADAPADRTMSDAQFLGRSHGRPQTHDRLEHADGFERRQFAGQTGRGLGVTWLHRAAR